MNAASIKQNYTGTSIITVVSSAYVYMPMVLRHSNFKHIPAALRGLNDYFQLMIKTVLLMLIPK